MVAVKSYEADAFLLRPPPHVFLYLVCGSDAGLISERTRQILKLAVTDPNDPFQLVRLGGDEIAADPLRLLDEANTIPLFGGRRAIGIDLGAKQVTPAIEMVLASPPLDCTIVIEAGALRTDAPLRKLLERDKRAATIECYPDDAKSIERIIQDTLARAGLAIERDASAALGLMLGADRLTTRAELEKLVLYCHGQTSVTVRDVENIIADASSLATNEAVNAAFSGNMSAVDATATRAFMMGNDANAVLATALWHATALHRGRIDRDASASAPRSGGGFGRSPVFETHLQDWSAARLQRCIANINEAIGKSRRDPGLAQILALRALMTIAQQGRELRR